MKPILPLDQMTTAEKLQALEAVWADLCRNPSDVPVPEWHERELANREKRLAAGETEFVDWDVAKQQIRDAIR